MPQKRVTQLEKKIRWYFKRYHEKLGLLELELLLEATWNERDKKVELTQEQAEKASETYRLYWKKLLQKIVPPPDITGGD
jgi:hypothetical protein